MAPRIVAHRGGSSYAPENTMAAFRKALELGADGIELDIHQTGDGKLVVIHDNTLDRVGGSPLRVGQASADDLREADVGAWFTAPDGTRFEGERIPLLSEVLAFAAETNLWLNVELKAGSRLYPGIEAACARMLAEYKCIDRVVVSSFDHYALRAMKQANPEIPVGVLHASGMIDAHEYANVVGADALHPHAMVVDRQYIVGARSLNMQINVWTVNDAPTAIALAAGGVDSLITDDPVLIREALASAAGGMEG